ncbi:sensor histidine kinase [Azospirillum rugosum]|uniref:histidine kinase n=1 Tax=Azospirillum rugosum TaxID=416170 RepID=A0ABS4SHI4_9PROT|nr:ATP-binding protein [Azospirillum rugosum]MBP2292034.1 PAS domain S-box-containing protein [Azospirillum rugosum]MDQ0525830.1 PAS domain S-box-containing protein [Azospirillum rugosum]
MDINHSDVFYISPIAILCEDWSGVKKAVDEVIAGGVDDFAGFLDANPDFIQEVRRTHRVLDANRAALDLFGYDDKDTFLRESNRLLPANRASNTQVLMAMAHGETVCQGERVLQVADGRAVPILWRASLPATSEGFDHLYFFAVDTTELKRVQAQLLTAQTNLSHAGRLSLVGELSASLTHEVSQPLVSIAGHAAAASRWLARETPNLEEVAASLARITASSRHAVEIVAKMRAFARRADLVPTQLRPQDCVADAIALIDHEAYRQKVTIGIDIPPGTPMVLGDRTRIQQVIVNIAFNAIQAMNGFTGPERRIAISAAVEDPDFVTVSISDTGPGIPEDVLPRIFQPFFSTKAEGMGLGLSICKTIVEEHGGRLCGRNGPTGATIAFTLPIAKGSGVDQPVAP